MQLFVKICAPQSDKTTRHTFMICLWICTGTAGYGIAALFAKCATFSQQKVPQSKDFGALQDDALRRGHQIVAHTVGESGALGAAFSSAAAAHLLHSF